MYIAALERCENNDKQDSYGGAPVVQRTDVQPTYHFIGIDNANTFWRMAT